MTYVRRLTEYGDEGRDTEVRDSTQGPDHGKEHADDCSDTCPENGAGGTIGD